MKSRTVNRPRFPLTRSSSATLLISTWLGLGGLTLSAQESISPQPTTPQPGLTPRAVPLPLSETNAAAGPRYVPLFRLTQPFYGNVLAVKPPQPPEFPDPSTYREVQAYEPLPGLHPIRPKEGLWNFTPEFQLAESYDSNLRLDPHNRIGDAYTTIGAGLDYQLGTPDSVYIPQYDTILALHARYNLAGDIFVHHDEFNALNHDLRLDGRIGRSDAIWRPYFLYQDRTGNDLLAVERTGRVTRERISSGFRGDYKLSPRIRAAQEASWLQLDHPDPEFIDFTVFRAFQQVGYDLRENLNLNLWGEFRDTSPSRGSSGDEILGGIGWYGKPRERLFTTLRIGWGQVYLDDSPFQRANLSGIRFTGYTTYDLTERFRFVVQYDRDYIFNELTPDDNYVVTGLQLSMVVFMGESWFLTPYFALTHSDFERTREQTLRWRPEIELAYAFEKNVKGSRVFIRLGYEETDTIKGTGDPVRALRVSAGLNFRL